MAFRDIGPIKVLIFRYFGFYQHFGIRDNAHFEIFDFSGFSFTKFWFSLFLTFLELRLFGIFDLRNCWFFRILVFGICNFLKLCRLIFWLWGSWLSGFLTFWDFIFGDFWDIGIISFDNHPHLCICPLSSTSCGAKTEWPLEVKY